MRLSLAFSSLRGNRSRVWVLLVVSLLASSVRAQGQARNSSSTSGTVADDTAALQTLKAAVGNSSATSSWTGSNPCGPPAWRGVNCTNGRVTQIALSGQNLSGSLPNNWGMSQLQGLDLSVNKLDGRLPGSWALPALQNLSLASNQLTGTLPASWAQSLSSLAQMDLRQNSLSGAIPGSWAAASGFAPTFTAMLQPGNTQLCGVVFPVPTHTFLYNSNANDLSHTLYGTIGSCAQGTCGQANINTSATNPYDIAWANTVAPVDLGASNSNLQVNAAPAQGTPLSLPCYPANPPTFFGADAALRGNSWQSSTAGNATAYLPVSGKANPQPPGDCSLTDSAPGWWMVDLQQSVNVQAVLIKVGIQMAGIQIRVGNNIQPAANALCTAPTNNTLNAGDGAIFLCDRVTLQGRYLSINATTRVSLCEVQVYPFIANAALGKPTSSSAASGGNDAQSQMATDGSTSTSSCTTVVNGNNLAAWLTVDLLYEAPVELVVIANGDSTFNNDLVIRLGNTPVVNGDENAVCSQNQSLKPRQTLPVQCQGKGRYLTLYRRSAGASDLYICEVFTYLSSAPTSFVGAAPSSPPSQSSPQPLPPPAAPPTAIDVNEATTQMEVVLQLSGPGLVPITSDVQRSIGNALTNAWGRIDGVDGVQVASADVGSSAGSPLAQSSRRRLLQAPAASPASAPGAGLAPTITVRAQVNVTQGQAPAAADSISQTVTSGQLEQALADQGLPGVATHASSISSIQVQAPPSTPSPSGPAPGQSTNNTDSGGSGSGGGSSVGAIVGGVVGGLAVLAAAVAAFIYVRRRKQQPGSPTLGRLEEGKGVNGYKVKAAGTGNGSSVLKLDPESLTQGPPKDVMVFLSLDKDMEGAGAAGAGNGGVDDTPVRGPHPLATPDSEGKRPGTSRLASLRPANSGVSELWTVDYAELDMQKQIGEGSFGKVHLAKWRETTVAVKVLAPQEGTALDEEFPPNEAAAAARSHPFYESLQKEAAMMASLRHPSIVMYLGVCLDPPAVVTEYCARGSLNDVLKRARSTAALAQQLDWPRRLNMALDAAKGMLYLHSCTPPIIHRDLKSPNLLVDKHWRVKVCDFNLSRVMEDSVVLSSVAATNPRWLAPEILSGKGYTFASDTYSFGIIMWELLTWQVPWHEFGPWQVVAMVTEGRKRPELPVEDDLPTPAFSGQDEYLALMCECWAQEPGDRPTFTAVISRLRTMLANETQLLRARHGSPNKGRRSSGASALGSTAGDDTPSVVRSQPSLLYQDSAGDSSSLYQARRLQDVLGSNESLGGRSSGQAPPVQQQQQTQQQQQQTDQQRDAAS